MYSCRMLVGITLNSRVIIVSNSSSSSGANENVERYSVQYSVAVRMTPIS